MPWVVGLSETGLMMPESKKLQADRDVVFAGTDMDSFSGDVDIMLYAGDVLILNSFINPTVSVP